MECIGAIRTGVVSLCSDIAGGSVVVSLNDVGTVHVWDTRCRQPRPPAFSCLDAEAGEDASEVSYFSESHKAVALCGPHVHVFDLRAAPTSVMTYEHQSEVVQLLERTPNQLNSDDVLLVDEDGFIFPFQISTSRPGTSLSANIFGSTRDLTPYPHPMRQDLYGFGSLTNYCCGLAVLSDELNGVQPHLFALGMDSHGVLYSGPSAAVRMELPQDEPGQQSGAQFINPPLPNCVSSCGAWLAVGKANGVYSLFELDSEGELNERLAAPGDAMNGLIYVHWLHSQGPSSLLTLSMCGDITVWGVGALLEDDDVNSSDDENAGALPEVQSALSLREFLGPAGSCVYANTCCALPQTSRYVLGDTSGHVLMFDIACDC